jgi:quinolinate synthase
MSESHVRELKRQLGDSLVILGHHYQRDEVIQFADLRGDSLKLAQDAAKCRDARYIVFCGVHFMAEVERAWQEIGVVVDVDGEVTPVTYVNSAATLKAFCGERSGSVCTSSNAAPVLDWALAQRPRVLFFPDQHLGRNTAKSMGIPLDEMVEWNPRKLLGGNDEEALTRAKIILWRGWCNVHQRFLPEDVTAWREREPGIRVIVHPECKMEVVDLADEAGSTSYIIRRVEEAEPGTKWAIGTEANLVHRLRDEHPDQFVASLSGQPSYCRTMNLITLEKLERILEGLVRDELLNRITVGPDVARAARVALERMLEVSG